MPTGRSGLRPRRLFVFALRSSERAPRRPGSVGGVAPTYAAPAPAVVGAGQGRAGLPHEQYIFLVAAVTYGLLADFRTKGIAAARQHAVPRRLQDVLSEFGTPDLVHALPGDVGAAAGG